jgi:hypothetical protein
MVGLSAGVSGRRVTMTFGRRHLAAAACVLLLVAVGGCSDVEPEPKFSPSESPTPSESATHEPAAWEVKSEAGAVAFAKHWVDVFNEASLSGDTSAMAELSSPACESCQNFIGMIDRLYSDGGFVEGGEWSVVSAVATEGVPASEATIALRVRQAPQKVHKKDGGVDSFEGGRVTYSAEMGWGSGAWAMNELVLLQ